MMKKIADSIEMSFEIPEYEQKHAEDSTKYIKKLLAALSYAKKHLSIVYDLFKMADSLPPNVVMKYRATIRRFKKQVRRNFNKVKLFALNIIIKLSEFDTDTHIQELINTFKDCVEELEKQVNLLFDILDDFRSDKYKENVLAGVEGVRRQSAVLEKILKDRIEDHINSNILMNDWVSTTKNENKIDIKERVPYITQLFRERQKALKG